MTPSDSDPIQRIDTRLNELEELFSHLERTVGDLDDGVRDCHERLNKLAVQFDHMSVGQKTLRDSIQENRTLEDDRPPHY